MCGADPAVLKGLGGVLQRRYLADLGFTTSFVAARHPQRMPKAVKVKKIRSRAIGTCLFGPVSLLCLCLLSSSGACGQGFADWELDGALGATHDPDPQVIAKALRFLADRKGPPERVTAELERNQMLRSILTGKQGSYNLDLIMPRSFGPEVAGFRARVSATCTRN